MKTSATKKTDLAYFSCFKKIICGLPVDEARKPMLRNSVDESDLT
jgi:hypothetical protein